MPKLLPRPGRLAALIGVVTLLACGDSAAPAPFADVQGDYVLQSVNGRPLPYNTGGSSWLFEQRLHLDGDGRYQRYTVSCNQRGEECPRLDGAYSGTMSRAGDGSLVFNEGDHSYVHGTVEPSGRFDLMATELSHSSPQPTMTYRYQRQ